MTDAQTKLPQTDAENAPLLTGDAARLVKLTHALNDLLTQETELLRSQRPREAGQFHGEKNRLMSEYRETLNRLQINREQLGGDNSEVRNHIKSVTGAFRETLRDHARIVLRLKSVAEGLIKTVSEEATRQTQPVIGYGSSAAPNVPKTLRPTSLSLNRTI